MRLLLAFVLIAGFVFAVPTKAESVDESVKKMAKSYTEALSIYKKKIKGGERICALGVQSYAGPVLTRVSKDGLSNGLQPGDKLLKINDEMYDATLPYGYYTQNFNPGQKLKITILRDGAELDLEIVCFDDTERVNAALAMMQAAMKGKWQQCIDWSYKLDNIVGIETGSVAYFRSTCTDANRCGRRTCETATMTDAYIAYRWRMLFLEESELVLDEDALKDIRPEILTGITWLEQSGFPRLASDLERQLNAAENSSKQQTVKPLPNKQASTQGTCFAVTDTEVLTSHHVVSDASFITVTFEDGHEIIADIKEQSRSTDLALLTLYEKTPAILPLATPRSLSVGQEVFTLGFPATVILGEDAKFTEGSVSSLSGIQGDATYFQMSVPIQPGNSGGPVVNMQGEVVGVVAATAAIETFYAQTGALPQNVNWASKSDYARMMFDLPKQVSEAASRSEAIQRVRSALCKVKAVRN